MPEVDTSNWTAQNWLKQYYKYIPSKEAAITFAVLFGITTSLHALQLLRRRTWYFIPFLVGGLFEVGGYTLRAIDADVGKKILFIVQTSLILLAPALYAASIYMVLKRIITLLDAEPYSLVRVKWLTKLFVGGDVLSFLTQGAGGSMVASQGNKVDHSKIGNSLIIVGLFIQIAIFTFFVIVTAVFHVRILKRPTPKSQSFQLPWLRYIYVLYINSAIIMVRSIFRATEYIQGRDGYLMSHEAYTYGLDTALMFCVSVMFNVFHPSTIVSRSSSDARLPERLERGEKGLGSEPLECELQREQSVPQPKLQRH